MQYSRMSNEGFIPHYLKCGWVCFAVQSTCLCLRGPINDVFRRTESSPVSIIVSNFSWQLYAFFPLSFLSLSFSSSIMQLLHIDVWLVVQKAVRECLQKLADKPRHWLFVWVEDVAGSGGMQSNDCKFSVCGLVRVHAIIPVTVLITRV